VLPPAASTFRLLFLSDTHLGLDRPRRPRGEGARRGQHHFESFERALAPARAGEVDAVLHGGDLLYRSQVPAALSEAALAPLRALAAGGLPVLLVPGNHERGRLPHPLLGRQEGLHVFDRPRTVVLAAGGLRVAFTGFPYAAEVRARFPALLAEAGWGAAAADLSLLCLHQCVEGASCGPVGYVFRHGPDVIRRADLPASAAAVLCGHVHRHQVLRGEGAPVVYAGATERTSRAEAGEAKGAVLLTLGAAGLLAVEHRAHPDRPLPPPRWWPAGPSPGAPGSSRAAAP